MKMDLQKIALSVSLLTVTACGQQKTSSQSFAKPAEECVADVVPGQFIAKFKDGSIHVVKAVTTESFLKGYATEHLEEIQFSEPDYFVRQNSSPTAQAEAPTTADNWGPSRIGADELWAAGIRGSGVIVAVVDSGMDLTHPSLKNQVAVNPNEVPGNGVDDDHNGIVDDVGGVDFLTNKPLKGDYQMHGSHVAGIIAAEHSDNLATNETYVQGVAPEAKILPLAFLNSDGNGLISDGVRAIKYAVTRGAKVINASWGAPVCSKSLLDTVNSLASKNVIFVSAAGNDSTNIDRNKEYPASVNAPTQITVGATGFNDLLAEYSNYGLSSVHIFAPGTSIISTVPGGMASLTGTSMATPFVAGAVALLLSAEPTATPAQIRQAIYASAYKQSTYINASNGRLDLRHALTELRHLMGH